MRKIMAVLLSIVMVSGLFACGTSSENSKKSEDENKTTNEQTAETEKEAETKTEDTKSAEKNSNILVAYFSATNTTKGVAEKIADDLNADLYEITPEEPYTSEDLDYNDSNSRCSVEMNDESARPVISDTVDKMEQYSTIFLGYPIWWNESPRIINTFLESYDFSGKTIIPFCTSASSGIENSESKLKSMVENADWIEGRRFNGSDAEDEIAQWVETLNLN